MKSALIIGSDSTIGAALATHLRAHAVEVHTTSRRKEAEGKTLFDLTDPPRRWGALPQTEVAFLCAAVTGLDACEDEPEGTKRVNVTHMQALAERLFEQGQHVVFISSNQVFNGLIPYRKASDAPSPVNEYGRQKAAFEGWLFSRQRAAVVLRLTKVINKPLPILESWSRALSQGKSIEAFADLVFAPLPLGNVLEGLALLGAERPRGIYQLSGTRDISYHAIATQLAQKLGVAAARVVATKALDSGIRPQFLPRNGTLSPSPDFANISCPEPFEAVGL